MIGKKDFIEAVTMGRMEYDTNFENDNSNGKL